MRTPSSTRSEVGSSADTAVESSQTWGRVGLWRTHIDHEVEQSNGVAPRVARRLGEVAVEQDGCCLPQPVGQTGLVARPGSGHRPAPSRCRRPPAERSGCVIRHEAERRSSRICR